MDFERVYEAGRAGSFQGKTTREKIDTTVIDRLVKRVAKKGIVDSSDVKTVVEFKDENESKFTEGQKKTVDELVQVLKETPLDAEYLVYRWNHF